MNHPPPSETMANPADFIQAMRQFAGAVTIITTIRDGSRTGLTATAVCSLTAEPPRILICVNKTASAHQPIAKGGVFCVNVLGTQHITIANRFAGRTAVDGDARFMADANWITLATGAPVLADALANFDCTVHASHDFGTHSVYVGDVRAATSRTGAPLMYSSGVFATATPIP
ncbi:MAG: flavin reductase family protein [Alphaproteobacteria bacterium]